MWNLSVPMRDYTNLGLSPFHGELSPTSGISKVEFVCPARTLAKYPTPNREQTRETPLILHLSKEMEEGLSIGSMHTGVEDVVHSI